MGSTGILPFEAKYSNRISHNGCCATLSNQIIVSLTQSQARLILSNIKEELEKNKLLIHDFGPFVTPDDEWRWNSLVISQFQTRIIAVSANESIRGFRHLASRPDLIICDDIEDLNSIKTQDGRDKTFR